MTLNPLSSLCKKCFLFRREKRLNSSNLEARFTTRRCPSVLKLGLICLCFCVGRYNTEQYSPYAAPSPQGSYQPSPSPQSYHQVAPSPVGYQNTHSPASYHPTPSPMAYQVGDVDHINCDWSVCTRLFMGINCKLG